jgi:hypothetical protein
MRSLESALEHALSLGDRVLAAIRHRAQAELYRGRGSEPVAAEHDDEAAKIESQVAAENPFPRRAPAKRGDREEDLVHG